MDIFISYSRKDSKIVDSFASLLEDLGYTVWIDRKGVESGDQFGQVITDAIKDSKVLLFFSSYSANNSLWTIGEVSIAKREGKKIIPIKLDDTQYNDIVRADLTMLDFVNYEPDHGLAKVKVVRAIAPLLGETEKALKLMEDGGDSTFTVTSRSAFQNICKRMKNSIKANRFKYIFCLVAIVFISTILIVRRNRAISSGYIDQLGEKDQIAEYLKATNANRNGEYIDDSYALLKAYEDKDYIVFPVSVKEDSIESFELSYFDIEDEREDIIESIRNSLDGSSVREAVFFMNNGRGIRRKYIGSNTGVEYDVDISKEEIKKVSIQGTFRFLLKSFVDQATNGKGSPNMEKALILTVERYEDSELDYLTLFVQALKEVGGNIKPAKVFSTLDGLNIMPEFTDKAVISTLKECAVEVTASSLKLTKDEVIDAINAK